MAKELSKEELINELESAFDAMWSANYGVNKKREKQAHKQLCKLIEDKGDINEVRKFFSVLVDIKSKEIHRLRELKKPKVSKEFIRGWWCKLNNHFTNGGNIRLEHVKQVLKEVGAEIEE